MQIFNNRRWSAGLAVAIGLISLFAPTTAFANEGSLRLPDLSSVRFFNNSIDGHNLLLGGLVVCVAGLVFGIVIYGQLKRLPVHKSMLEVSELIYATCKTYLLTQLKFICLLECFIGVVIFIYFKFLAGYEDPATHALVTGYPLPLVLVILLF